MGWILEKKRRLGSETFSRYWQPYGPRPLCPLPSPASVPQWSNPGKSPVDVVHTGQVLKQRAGWERMESKSGGTLKRIPGKQVFFLLFFFFFFFCLFRAVATPYGSSQVRGRMGTVAAGLHHSHSSVGSKQHLQRIPHTAHGNTQSLTH